MIANAVLAVGLVMFVEGLAYALAPSIIEDLLEALRNMSLSQRRAMGFIVMCLGLVCVWAAKSLGV